MKTEELTEVLLRLAKATKNQPATDDIDVMTECILDNKLSDPEIMCGYRACRDAPEPWWPKPGEFLAKARPSGPALVSGEAETIFQHLLDSPQKYGKYNPHCGVVIERRLVEARHGKAAGMAFAAVASRFRGLLEESVPFVRKDFRAAYDDARRDYGAPLTLSLPGAKKSIPGATEEVYEPF